MSCDDFSKEHIQMLAKDDGMPTKGLTKERLCALLKSRGLIPEIPPLKEDCGKKTLSLVQYQAGQLGISNTGVYNKKTKQLLCDKISQSLDDRDEKDDFSEVEPLGLRQACDTSGILETTVDYLQSKEIQPKTLSNIELIQVASKLGFPGVRKLDRGSLCHIIKKEISRLDYGGNPREPVQERARRAKAVLHSTYDRVVIEDEEKLSIPQLSRCLTKKILDSQQILPAVVLSEKNGIILAHNVGTGKTLAAINTSQVLLRKKFVEQVIVITPTSLQFNFIKQFKDYNKDLATDIRYHYYTPTSFLIQMVKGAVPMDKNTLLIIDEAHNYRTDIASSIASDGAERIPAPHHDISPKLAGRRVRAVFNFLHRCPHVVKVLLLTATPLVNGVADLYNLVAMANRAAPAKFRIIDEVEKDEKAKPVVPLPLYNGCDIHFYDTPEREKHLFPRQENSTLYFEMSQDYYQGYTDIQNSKESEEKKGLTVFYNGVRRAANSLDLVKSQKLAELVDQIRRKVTENSKIRILVYSSWIEAGLKSIEEALKGDRISTEAITGRLSKIERNRAVEAFNAGRVNVLLLSRAGGEGLDLKATNIVYIVDPTWNDASVQQIIGRAVRRESHISLPEAERVVQVFSMILLKPFEGMIMTKGRTERLPGWRNAYKEVFLDPTIMGRYPEETLRLTNDKRLPIKGEELDNIMSIDLYLYKFMRKKQVIISFNLQALQIKSRECFDPIIEDIKRELAVYVAPIPLLAQEEEIVIEDDDDREAAILELLGKNTIVIEGSIEENQPHRPDAVIRLFRDIPLQIKEKGSPLFTELPDNTKLKLFVVSDKEKNKTKVVLFYKNREDKVVRENIIL